MLGPGEYPIESVHGLAQESRGLIIDITLPNTTSSSGSFAATLQHAKSQVTRAILAKSAGPVSVSRTVVVPEGAVMFVLKKMDPRNRMALSMLAQTLDGLPKAEGSSDVETVTAY